MDRKPGETTMSAYPIFHNKVLDADKLNNEYLPRALATLAPSEHEVLVGGCG
jgi:hypothetical protein